MPTLTLLTPSPCTTVQDLGRPGCAHLGLPASGPTDPLSHRLANRLLGNAPGAAALEAHALAPDISANAPALLCLTGGRVPNARIIPADPSKPDRLFPPNTPTLLAPGDTLRLGPIANHHTATIAIAGGLHTPVTLSSRSAHAATAIGGRPLAKGDTLPFASPRPGLSVSPLDPTLAAAIAAHLSPASIRVIPHPQADPPLLETFLASAFVRHPSSSRTGTRLTQTAGPPIPAAPRNDAPSEPAHPGTIQLPPSAGPIVLGPDNPTVGGYPHLATVITADLPAFHQRRPGDTLTFRPVNADESRAALRAQHALLQSVPRATEPPHILCDTGEAEPGHARDAERAILPHVTAVAIACGGHAGDDHSMHEAVTAALQHNLTVGAHPSFPDRANFGRTPRRIPADITLNALLDSIRDQLAALQRICDSFNDPARARIAFIKPHGSLYHAVSADPALARALAHTVRNTHPGAALVAAAGSPAIDTWHQIDAEPWPESFADRAYAPDGSILPRTDPAALITDPTQAASQAKRLSASARAVCVHSDTPNALPIARAVHEAFAHPYLPGALP